MPHTEAVPFLDQRSARQTQSITTETGSYFDLLDFRIFEVPINKGGLYTYAPICHTPIEPQKPVMPCRAELHDDIQSPQHLPNSELVS
jgi:hypothetical protein